MKNLTLQQKALFIAIIVLGSIFIIMPMVFGFNEF